MYYDKKHLFKCLLGLGVMTLLMRVSNGAGFAVILPLIVFVAIKKNPASLLFLLVLSISMLVGNGNLMPKGAVFGYAQRAAMLLLSMVMLVQVFGRRNSPLLKPFMLLLPYLLWMALVSGAGWCPFISYLKLLLFTSVYFGYYGVANMVSFSWSGHTVKIRSVFLALAIFFILGSMALVPFPGISQLGSEEAIAALVAGERLTSLFMGMTFHSQALGPVCALLGTALFADLLFGIRRADKLYILMLLCVPFLIWRTSSRTAMGAFIFGLLTCLWLAFGSRMLAVGWRRKVTFVMTALFSFALVASVCMPSIRTKLAGFLLKYNENAELSQISSDEILRTRRGKWDEGIENFSKSPIIGNGFQVSENMRHLKPDLSTLSAPVEKSVWISAVLEEGGAIGLILFSIFLIFTILLLKRRNASMGLALFLVFVIINLGEFTFFSMSGFGGFAWALVFVGAMLDAQRLAMGVGGIIQPRYEEVS